MQGRRQLERGRDAVRGFVHGRRAAKQIGQHDDALRRAQRVGNRHGTARRVLDRRSGDAADQHERGGRKNAPPPRWQHEVEAAQGGLFVAAEPAVERVSERAGRRIAVLAPLFQTAQADCFESGWNRRLMFSFGGGCGTNYNQGTNQATAVLMDAALARGFAHAISTQNVMQLQCNDHLSGEALMMIKEHFIERYGLPEWTMGFGGSGGAIQQLLIAQNFPALLDGIAALIGREAG